jgi:hypothetical protein
MDGIRKRHAEPMAWPRPLIVAALLVSICLNGCAYDPKRFQLPSLTRRHPAVERRLADFHDPFPDDTLGPESSARPPSFARQRTLPRRAADLRGVHLLNPRDRLPPDATRAPKNRFAGSVRP